MGLLSLFADAVTIMSVGDALEDGVSPKEIIMNAFQDTVVFLFEAAGNEGQLSIIENEIIPNLERSTALALSSSPEFDWEEIRTNYPDAVGEMVEEANNIMHEACRTAEELVQAIEEAIEEALIDRLSLINPILGFFARLFDFIFDLAEEAEDQDEDRRGFFG